MKKLKVRFEPLEEPKPVKLDMMPDDVECVVSYCGCKQLLVLHRGAVYRPGDNGGTAMCPAYNHPNLFTVLSRLDGQPLPQAEIEPVPLDTLQPWPVFYKGKNGCVYAHDSLDGFFEYSKNESGCFRDDGACLKSVLPTPYRMITEVED